ncbi:uncharacterized protein LAESUDRAFT_54962 [Laetiporus sulphureus 93-53]|uniref:Uncharacterized protein n=1 Tax=Laetiporus sulphureus 93-53 TaxID=1314785 RepID=A0A165FCU2_9APHY|nr:uncharacterized protein LAESUDRAFT_54962 [Laetiporus sulphureus 93-53]KZT08775.1 hypothetical protein LAESUDRAFT_54962 [Laetiporus sulphureus 93-53]
MASELSLRHFPEVSETSMIPEMSEASFQIPHATGGSSADLLMGDASMDLLHGADYTFASPVSPTRPLRVRKNSTDMPESTPRRKAVRSTPLRTYALRPRPGRTPSGATPLRAVVGTDMTPAAGTSSIFGSEEASFQIPVAAREGQSMLLNTIGESFQMASVTRGDDPQLNDDGESFQIPISPRKGYKLLLNGEGESFRIPFAGNENDTRPHYDGGAIDATFATANMPSPASTISPLRQLTSKPTSAPLTPAEAIAADEAVPQQSSTEGVTSLRDANNLEIECTVEQPPRVEGSQPAPIPIPTGTAVKPSAASAELSDALPRVDKARRKKPTVIGGGITKAGKPRAQVFTLKHVLSTAKTGQAGGTDQRLQIEPSSEVPDSRAGESKKNPQSNGSIPSGSAPVHGITAGGLASTLISFGQKYIKNLTKTEFSDRVRTHAPVKKDVSARTTPHDTDVTQGQPSGSSSAEAYRDADRDGPLTLSQLSRPSDAPAPTETRQLRSRTSGVASARPPPSPVSPPLKRPRSPSTSAASRGENKRSRTSSSGVVAAASRQGTSDSSAHALRRSRVRTAEAPAAVVSGGSHVREASADLHAKRVLNRSGTSSSGSRSAIEQEKKKSASRRQLTRTRTGLANSRSTDRSEDLHASQKENAPGGKQHPGHGHARKASQELHFNRPVSRCLLLRFLSLLQTLTSPARRHSITSTSILLVSGWPGAPRGEGNETDRVSFPL